MGLAILVEITIRLVIEFVCGEKRDLATCSKVGSRRRAGGQIQTVLPNPSSSNLDAKHCVRRKAKGFFEGAEKRIATDACQSVEQRIQSIKCPSATVFLFSIFN